MPAPERIIARHEPCPWLPEGGVAEVVLAYGSSVPHPTPVARLLVTSEDAVLAVPREDGRGLDLPTAATASGITATVRDLWSNVLATGPEPSLLGFVRNDVVDAPDSYPWPTPIAHFAVWHCHGAKGEERRGQWLEQEAARAELGKRHWWPLVDHVPSDLRAR